MSRAAPVECLTYLTVLTSLSQDVSNIADVMESMTLDPSLRAIRQPKRRLVDFNTMAHVALEIDQE
jgi:hypothetical protein